MKLIISMLAMSLVTSAAFADNTVVKADPKATEASAEAVTVIEATSIALRGKPVYSSDVTHFNYVNPDAPKGGEVIEWARGTFDNFNAYSQRGDAARDISDINDSLMESSADDISAYYPLIAEKISYNSDYSAITFHLNKKAVFHDGERIKPSDVKFSFEKLSSEGLPGLKAYYSYVEKIELLDDYRVKFHLSTKDKGRMIDLVGFTVFPEHFWKDHKLNEPLKIPPLGSGPYKVGDYKFGKYVSYDRVKDYWAKDLPIRKGAANIGTIRFDYYLDETVAFEAFKAGHIDKWSENTAKRWATGYDFPAIASGQVIKKTTPHSIPLRASGLIFNLKKPLFADIRVRKAMTQLLDFEWMNKNLFYDQYIRVNSLFMNTKYVATGLPSEAELALLEPLKDQLPASVFTEPFELPKTNGSGNIRSNLRQALRLFKEAGWTVKNQKLVDAQGKQFEFEIMLVSAGYEKVALAFGKNLKRAGIKLNVRTVDSSQYMARYSAHDFDMIAGGYREYSYPSSGFSQAFESKSVNSSYNPANLTNDAVDSLLEHMESVQDDEEKLLVVGHALDRVLMHTYLMIPTWNLSSFRMAHWDKFGKPETTPLYDEGDSFWWVDEKKAATLKSN
ncbi:extracellular solute-binding protein [Leucothrix arctica]|uniref:ABC transporter substrate-binding protein n=1 Tax=Leucothrix arctica TaxID=1481894 RepID=A0A317CLU9_9GAMM|nr:extracellular solute-binding protein [Leucothrix arctica]PWQ99565.1 ABC transporter substrate-binding protein [Leucothrix arctica]